MPRRRPRSWWFPSWSIATPARVFDRVVTVAVEQPPSQRRRDPWIEVLANTRWVHADQEREARPFTVQLPSLHTTDILVIVDEGDNTPLPLGKAHVVMPATRIRLYREQGMAIRLAYGRADLSRPRYDLALFPAAILVCDLSARARAARPLILAASGALMCTGVSLFSQGRWLG